MTANAGAWGEDGKDYDGKDFRFFTDSVFEGPGVVGDNDLQVTQQVSPGSTVQIAAGKVVVTATQTGKFGKYQDWNDAPINSPSIAATSAGVFRKDRLIWRITNGVGAPEIVQGTASGTPAEPTIPGDNYEELALITLPPSTSNITNAMITDRRRKAYTTQGGRLWTPYTPAWTTTGTAATLGNGTLTGRYMKLGRQVTFGVFLTFGSSTNGGTGNYAFSLPFAAAAVFEQWVNAKIFSVSATDNWLGMGYIAAGSSTVVPYLPSSHTETGSAPLRNSSTGAVGESIPLQPGAYVLSSGANVWVGGTYESAA